MNMSSTSISDTAVGSEEATFCGCTAFPVTCERFRVPAVVATVESAVTAVATGAVAADANSDDGSDNDENAAFCAFA